MPGPFPGMDPYLEDPLLFPGVHQSLITFIRGQLNASLPSNYMADIGGRVYIETRDRSTYPDVTVSERESPRIEPGSVAVIAAPNTVLTVAPVEMRELFVEVLAVGRDQGVVTTIEVLSPANKRAASDGRDLYVKNQEALLAGDVHLVEIDLLRSGAHTVAAPKWKVETLGRIDYLVLLHRSDKRWDFRAWGNRMRERLPRVQIPLLPGDPDVILDLQECMDQAYDNGPYKRRVDYTRVPAIALAEDDAAWADLLLRGKLHR